MDEKSNDLKQAGTFIIAPDRNVYGELRLAGPDSSLTMRDKDFINGTALSGTSIIGVLHDLSRVTLVDCVTTEESTTGGVRGSEGYHSARVFPHFVLQGTRHLNPWERNVSAIHFLMRDASSLFYDFDAFGRVIHAQSLIEQIVKANDLPRQIPVGPDPQILYFTGRTEIFSVETSLGVVSANHWPTYPLGGPDGISLKNKIKVTITFNEPVAFRDAIARLMILRGFFGLLIGRDQGVLDTSITTSTATGADGHLDVHWSLAPGREVRSDRGPHPADVLVDPLRSPEAFPKILASWLDQHNDRRDARMRFFGLFARGQYDIDSLVGLANVFDILPSSAVPTDVSLSPDLDQAKRDAISRFKNLPQSPERDSVLGALGRLGKAALKQKIRHRVKRITDATTRFPELHLVTDEAVNCRNHYVHGSPATIDYSVDQDLQFFFTDTLEFVFAASDLIDAGWDINAWINEGTTMSHRFGRYRVEYQGALASLKEGLKGAAQGPA
jgi:hypothetical protein